MIRLPPPPLVSLRGFPIKTIRNSKKNYASTKVDQLTLIHHLDYTNQNPNNALQISLLYPKDIRPNDIVICDAQPGLHWEACPPLTGDQPVRGESFTGNNRVITLPRHPPPNITGDKDRQQGAQARPAKRKLDFPTPPTDNPITPSTGILMGGPAQPSSRRRLLRHTSDPTTAPASHLAHAAGSTRLTPAQP